MLDPRTISLDLETYGICKVDPEGNPAPEQRYFHPLKSLAWDRPPHLLVTCSITIPLQTSAGFSNTGRLETSPFGKQPVTNLGGMGPENSSTGLRDLEPGGTMVLDLWKDRHLKTLAVWIKNSDTMLGMNFMFDILYLRRHPLLRPLLDGRHTIIDLSVLNYLHNENRKERSLKNIGPLLRLYSYDPEVLHKNHRFDTIEEVRPYNAQDTHNTMLGISELAKRIPRDYPCPSDTSSSSLPSPSSSHMPLEAYSRTPTTSTTTRDKLSPFCIQFFSDSIWSCVRMSEAGIPLDIGYLRHLESILYMKATLAHRLCLRRHNIPLSGDGSSKAKSQFLRKVLDEVQEIDDTFIDNPILQWTPKKKEFSTADLNRLLLSKALPPTHSAQEVFHLWDINSSAHKLISTYISPLLREGNNPEHPNDSTAIPWRHIKCLTLDRSRSSQPQSSSSCSHCGASISTPAAPEGTPTKYRRQTSKYYRLRHAGKRPKPTGIPKSRRLYDEVPCDPPPIVPHKREVGICYPSWFLLPSPFKDSEGEEGGQKQARLSCKQPAASTWPSAIKAALTSRFTGGVIASFDLSQVELRVAGILSGCPSLMRAFDDGLDLHTDRAISVYGLDELAARFGRDAVLAWHHDQGKKLTGREDFEKNFRQPCKHANFTDLNLGGAETLQRTIFIKSGGLIWHPLEKCREIVARRPIDRPGLTQWQNSHIDRVRADGVCILPFTGISRYFLGGTEYDDSEIVNFPIQATAATTMRCIQHWLDKNYLPSLTIPNPPIYSCYNVYDAAFFDCKSPAHAASLQNAIADAVTHVATQGYWSWMQDLTGHHVSLLYDFKVRQ